ncbi:MAG: hypothetical protein ACMXYK_01585 [Candidatus Woesearchaeota archaeon]
MRKGQITLFILVGIFIVGVIAIVLSIASRSTFQSSVSSSDSSFSLFLQECSESIARDGIMAKGFSDLSSLESYVLHNMVYCIPGLGPFNDVQVLGPASLDLSLASDDLVFIFDYNFSVIGDLTEKMERVRVQIPLSTTGSLSQDTTVHAPLFAASLSIPPGVRGQVDLSQVDAMIIRLEDLSARGGIFTSAVGFSLEPEGTILNQPVTLSLDYDFGLIPYTFSDRDITLRQYNDGVWEKIPSIVDTDAQRVHAEITEFSKYALTADIDLRHIGDEETVSAHGFLRAVSIDVDGDDNPHIVTERPFYLYSKLDDTWGRTEIPDGWEVPRIRIDDRNRGWISWCRFGEESCYISISETMNTNPVFLKSRPTIPPNFVGYVAVDSFRNEAIVIGGDGGYERFNDNLDFLGVGSLPVGPAGEKIEVQLSPRENQPGVWHAAMGGYNKSESGYINSDMQTRAIWAGMPFMDEAGNDGSYVSLGVDLKNPHAAYIGSSYNPNHWYHGVSINMWDGERMVFGDSPLLVDDSAANFGNGVRRFSP